MRKTLSKKEINNVFKRIRQSIKDDIEPLVKRKKGGYFAVPRLVFAEIDFLGGLYINKPNQNTKNAISFIHKYFSQTNRWYKVLGEAVYIMYRHGTIHEYQPKILRIKNGPVFVSAVGKRKDKFNLPFEHLFIHLEHLKIKQHLFRNLHKYINDPDYSLPGSYVGYWIPISLNSLLNELYSAIDLFEKDISKKWYLRKRFSDGVRKLGTPTVLSEYSYQGKISERKIKRLLSKLFA